MKYASLAADDLFALPAHEADDCIGTMTGVANGRETAGEQA
jgi:hypothetical protein